MILVWISALLFNKTELSQKVITELTITWLGEKGVQIFAQNINVARFRSPFVPSLVPKLTPSIFQEPYPACVPK